MWDDKTKELFCDKCGDKVKASTLIIGVNCRTDICKSCASEVIELLQRATKMPVTYKTADDLDEIERNR
jgi:hypothetical protein